MPELHNDCKARAKQIIESALQGARVLRGSILEIRSLVGIHELDAVLPNSLALKNQLSQFLGDSSFSEFAIDFLWGWFVRRLQFDEAAEPKSIVEWGINQSRLADELIAEFEGVPHKYLFSLPLPSNLASLLIRIAPLQLTENCAIVENNSHYEGSIPAGQRAVRALASRKIEKDSVVNEHTGESESYWHLFSVQEAGYAGFVLDFAPAERVFDQVKSIFGFLLAYGLLEPGGRLLADPVRHAWVHRYEDDEFKFHADWDVPVDLAEELCRLKPLDALNDWRGKEWFAAIVSRYYTASKNERNIPLAAQWLFDAWMGTRSLLSYIQAVTALEILVGQGGQHESVGVTALIATRCAYLLASNARERSEIYEDVESIYHTRSRIIHQGKNRLTRDDSGNLRKLRSLCGRVLAKEVELASANEKGVGLALRGPSD